MSEPLLVGDVDVDRAIGETAEEAVRGTRANFLRGQRVRSFRLWLGTGPTRGFDPPARRPSTPPKDTGVDYRGGIDQVGIAARLRRSDLSALEELFDAYANYVLVLARHITRDEETAEQAVHEGFLDIWHDPSTSASEDLYARLLKAVHRRAVGLRNDDSAPGRHWY